MTDSEILKDIRLRLKGMPQSMLHGDHGLVQATVDAWAEAATDADIVWTRVRDLESALHSIASIALPDVKSGNGTCEIALRKIVNIAKSALK